MEKISHEYYSDLFDGNVHFPSYEIKEGGYYLKNIPPALVNALARPFKRYLSVCKVPTPSKIGRAVFLLKKGDLHDIGNYRPICLPSVVYKICTRVIILDSRIDRTLDDGQPCEKAEFRSDLVRWSTFT
ncbi:unnamed protein product [Angiostrongylus costaricensis]|uniref:RNA-directed DNA polymerase-like protein n=1 Tax=Angiostrongylus costaricensis TaxID=334426 RepID=A0A0R3PZI7_ANGCS|nr:unnamed protein product [Angiostrongylus costaricensis]